MAYQAVVTLNAVSSGIFPQTRTIKLNPDRPLIPIGRASKSVSKGLVGAENNAWFDSPVMSRDHAELSFDQDNMAIKIQDLSSMHGTMVNDVRLLKDPQALKCGDMLLFGAEVRRGPDTFPPCCFKIDYEFSPWTRGFQCPESSDGEDELDASDADVSLAGDVNTSVEGLLPKCSGSIEAIDLTIDNAAEKFTGSMDTIDLTQDEPVSAIVVDDVQGQGLDIQEKPSADHPVPQKAGEVVTNQAFVDSASEEGDDACWGEEYERENFYESEDESGNDGSDKENNGIDRETDEEDRDSVSDWMDDPNDSKDAAANVHSDVATSDSTSDSCERPNATSERMFYDNKDIPVSNMRSTTRDLPEVSVIVEHRFDGSSGVAWETGLNDSAGEEATHAKPAEPNGTMSSTLYSQPSSYHCTQGQTTERQPSPSDAAMMKSMGQSQPAAQQGVPNFISTSQTVASNTVNPTSVHHLPSPEWNNVNPASVGSQAKRDFFNARKENLAALCSRGQYPESSMSSMWGDRAPTKLNLNMTHQYNGHTTQLGSSHPYNFNRPQTSAVQEKIRELALLAQRERSATERMLGENNHNQQMLAHMAAQRRLFSQRALVAQANAQAIAAQKTYSHAIFPLSSAGNHRTADNSNDKTKPPSEESPGTGSTNISIYSKTKPPKEVSILPSSNPDERPEPEKPLEASSKPSKRKFSELEKQGRDSAETSHHSTGRGDTISEDSSTTDSRALHESPRDAPTPQHERSRKRLKRFVEAAGYAALGGLAVGAGLFSILVATAPEFA